MEDEALAGGFTAYLAGFTGAYIGTQYPITRTGLATLTTRYTRHIGDPLSGETMYYAPWWPRRLRWPPTLYIPVYYPYPPLLPPYYPPYYPPSPEDELQFLEQYKRYLEDELKSIKEELEEVEARIEELKRILSKRSPP